MNFYGIRRAWDEKPDDMPFWLFILMLPFIIIYANIAINRGASHDHPRTPATAGGAAMKQYDNCEIIFWGLVLHSITFWSLFIIVLLFGASP